jgi:hypothetical protein
MIISTLAPYLKEGENTIAVFVVYYGKARSFWMPAATGGALGGRGVFVFEANLGQTLERQTFEVSETSKVSSVDGWLVSDASWQALTSDAWSEDWKNPAEMHPLFGDAIPTEVVDARRLPVGWEQPGFDDRAWGASHIIPTSGPAGSGGRTQPPTAPYGPLLPRPIGKLGGDLRVPISLRAETLAGQVADLSADPVKRLQKTLDLAASPAPGDRLPLAVDVPPDGCVRITLDMGGIVIGQVQLAVEAPAGAAKTRWRPRAARSTGCTRARATWRAARTTASRSTMRSGSVTPTS